MHNIVDVAVPWDHKMFEDWRDLTPREYCFTQGATTNVMAVVGEGTAFEAKAAVTQLPNDLILIIEVRNTRVHWMAPIDLDVSELKQVLSRRRDCFPESGNELALGTSEDGFLVGFLDGEVWMLSHKTPAGSLLAFCSCTSAEKYDRQEVLGAFLVARAKSMYGSSAPGKKTSSQRKR